MVWREAGSVWGGCWSWAAEQQKGGVSMARCQHAANLVFTTITCCQHCGLPVLLLSLMSLSTHRVPS